MGACHSKRIAPEGTLPKLPKIIPKRTSAYNINNRVLTIPNRYHTISY